MPAHCGITGNERADVLAKETSALRQEDVPMETRALTKAFARAASRCECEIWPDGLFRGIWRDRAPTPVFNVERDAAVDLFTPADGRPLGSVPGVPPAHRPPTLTGLQGPEPELRRPEMPGCSVSAVRG